MAFSIQSFRKTLLYQTSTPTAQLQVNLKQIAEQDKLAEQQAQKYQTIAIICGLLAVGSIFLTASVSPWAMVLLGLFFMATVITGIISSRWNRLNIPDLRYCLPERLVEMLSRDMSRSKDVEVRLDFSSATKKAKKVSTQPYPARRGWKEDSFEDPWLQLKGHFLDNTEFVLHLTELTVARYGWKRGRSGKNKFKRKTKPKGFESQLLLKFPRKKYGAIKMMESDLAQAIKLPPGVVLKQLKVNDHQLLLRIKIPIDSQVLRGESRLDALYRSVAQMFLSAYQGLNLSKELSKATG